MASDLSAEERSLRARIAVSERWAKTHDRTTATAPARAAAQRARWAREIDPDGVMPPAQLEARLEEMQRVHHMKVRLRAKTARRKAREARDVAQRLDQQAAELDQAADDLAADAGGPTDAP
jgi:hypothetical protein